MKMLICLHGNPSNGQEFDPIIPTLETVGYQTIIHKRPLKGSINLEALLQSINATAKVSGGGSFGLVAYSWGAYLALSYLRRFPENVMGVLLINPLLIDKNPLSLSSRLILATPFLRSIVLRLKSLKLAVEYIRKMFFPSEPSEEIKKSLYQFLSQGSVWRGAAGYKKLMINSPLSTVPASLEIPLRVLFGEKDEVAPKLEQLPYLQMVNNFNSRTIPDAGHAIPWTHSQYIVEEVKKMIPADENGH